MQLYWWAFCLFTWQRWVCEGWRRRADWCLCAHFLIQPVSQSFRTHHGVHPRALPPPAPRRGEHDVWRHQHFTVDQVLVSSTWLLGMQSRGCYCFHWDFDLGSVEGAQIRSWYMTDAFLNSVSSVSNSRCWNLQGDLTSWSWSPEGDLMTFDDHVFM